MVLTLVLLAIVFLYIFFEVNYFLKTFIVILVAKFCRRKISIAEPSEIYGIVVPSDADLVMDHLNNARYFREYDFGRIDLATRTGLVNYFFKKGEGFPISAFYMRFRLPAMLFSVYKVVTQVVYWDSQFLYLDQRLVTLKDGIVRAAGYAKIACRKINPELVIKELDPNFIKPEMPADLKIWNEALEVSKEMMKTTRSAGVNQ